MATDLTKGSPLKQILFFSIPFLIGNLFQQFYNIADMVIVGRTISPEAYAADGSTGSLVWFTVGAMQSLTAGFSTITARYVGANDSEGIKRSFAASIKLTALIALLMSVVCTLLCRPMLELLRSPDDIIDRSYAYLFWIFAGLVATAFYNLLSNMIRALGDSRTPLYFLIIACVVNIILDFVFIVLCGMDTDGAGLATVVAQLISALCCAFYIAKKQPLLHVRRHHFAYSGEMNRLLLGVGIPMAFLNMVLSMGSIAMQFVTNGLGTNYVSAQATGAKIETFATQPLLSIGSATSVYTAQNYGAKRYDRIIEGGKRASLLGFFWCVIAAVILIPLGKFIVTLLAGDDVSQAVIDASYFYILINTSLLLIVMPLVVYKNVLQAVGRTFWTMMSGFTEIVGRVGISAMVIYLMSTGALADQTGFRVMCFANPAAWLIGVLTILLDYVFLMRMLNRLAAEQKGSVSASVGHTL
ncbi:MAG: MATE family efflux transporter [Clostridia bacterium]|nr:MATE family efflux transporter [Clostridia bacterium]